MRDAVARIVLRSAIVYSPRYPYSTSVIVSSGQISWIGDDTGLTGQLLPGDQVIDCEQRLIAPGFFDASRIAGRPPTPELIGSISNDLLWQRTTATTGVNTQLEPPGARLGSAFRVLPGGDPDGQAAELLREGVPIAFGSFDVDVDDPWVWIRDAVFSGERGISARAAFNAVTRSGWRLAGIPDLGDFAPGREAHFNIWECEALDVQAPDDRVSRWSTDERAGTSPLPDLRPGQPLPRLWATVNQHDLWRSP